MTALGIVSWVLTIGAVASIIAAGAALAWDRATCTVTPRWITVTLFGSIIIGSLSSITAQVNI